MQRYENCLCDSCGKPFAKDDDIVICPICGTPMHRACYQRTHVCPHESEHAAGFEWKYPAAGAGAKVACRHCGAMNEPEALFCQLCGQPLRETGKTREEIDPDDAGEWRDSYTYGERIMPGFDVDGVSSEELRTYLGRSGELFLLKFRMILSGSLSPVSWNLAALIFGPFYYFYRRMKKQGLLLFLLLLVIYIPGYLYSIEYFKAYLAPEMFGATFAYSEALIRTLEPVSAISGLLRIALHLYCCVRANRDLLSNAIADIRALHEQVPEAQRGDAAYQKALIYRGAPAPGLAALTLIGFFVLLYVITAVRLGAPVGV